MPGIVGIISKASEDESKNNLRLMLKSMLYEPFYNSGVYSNEQMGLYVGWVCHQGSFSDCMPVWNEKKDVLLIYFGENYADLELFDKLKANHHRFDRTNASYLIHLYEDYGVNFLNQLNGHFSGVLFDLRSNEVLIFNDRFGIQRLFYYRNKGGFYFSSEAKAILEVCPKTREIDMQGLGELLCCNCVLENRSLYKNINLLPGASVWRFHPGGNIVKQKYFSAESLEKQSWLEDEFFYEKLRFTFTRILPRYFRTKQKIGISLTGGLDTRIVMANIEMPTEKYPCYTFGSKYRDSFDVKVARKVALKSEQNHQVLQLGKTFLSNFSLYADKTIRISDGYCGVSSAYEVYLNGLAREIAPIRMTGNYGGEILRGIEGVLKFVSGNKQLYNPDIHPYFIDAAKTLADLYKSSDNALTFNLFYEIPWYRNHGFVIEQSQLTPRTPYLDNDLVALVYRAPPNVRNNMKISLRLIADGNEELLSILSDRGFCGNIRFPLSKAIEVYYEFLFKAEYAYNYGMPQWLAAIDYKLRRYELEKYFLGRHKFSHFRIWYRDELSHYIENILLDEKSLNRSYLNRNKVKKIVKSHITGHRNYTTDISKLLNLELIHRLLIDR